MSKLPEHRRSPEEIARLREDLGIVQREHPHPAPAPPAGPSFQPGAAAPLPAPVATQAAPPQPAAPRPPQQPDPPPTPRGPKPVRSLKRSERLAPASSRDRPAHPSHPLPDHRHTPGELAELRRREAAEALAKGGFEIPREASGPLLGLAYGLSLVGAGAPLLMNLLGRIMASHHVAQALGKGYHLLVACCAAALVLAAFIFLRRTQSRHHAAIIAIIAAFALIFSLLHFFPTLRYGQ